MALTLGILPPTTSPSCQTPFLDPNGQWEYPDVSQKVLKSEYVGTRPCNNQHHSAKTVVSKKLTATIILLPP